MSHFSPLPIGPAIGLGLVLACNPGVPAATDTDASSTGSSGDATTTTSSTATTDPTTTDPTTAAATTAGEQGVTTEILRYATQPMVVDVVLTTTVPATTISLAHADDPGVEVEAIAVAGLATTYRVRGLAPDTEHSLQYDVDGLTGPVDFITYPALPGFIPSFAVAGDPVDPAVPYRLFDLIPFPAFDTASVFMVDAEGTTRWHLGGPSTGMAGPEGVYTAVHPRDDGSIMYLHDHVMWIRDELGNTIAEVSDDMLGVTGLHHELLELPNGNFMALSFGFQDIDYGMDGIVLTAGDVIVEFTPEGELVWTWSAFDHLNPQRRIEPLSTYLLHPTTGVSTYDWTHGNALVYEPDSDTVLLSMRHQDWIISIDHKTGDVQWKLGQDGDFTLVGPGPFPYHQHAPEWQADGSLLLYDNHINDPDIPIQEVHSRAVRFELDLVAKTAARVWADDGDMVLVPYAGNADRLPGGRILVTDSSILLMGVTSARLRELDPDASPMLKWSLDTPPGSFAYRGSAHERLIGRPKP